VVSDCLVGVTEAIVNDGDLGAHEWPADGATEERVQNLWRPLELELEVGYEDAEEPSGVLGIEARDSSQPPTGPG